MLCVSRRLNNNEKDWETCIICKKAFSNTSDDFVQMGEKKILCFSHLQDIAKEFGVPVPKKNEKNISSFILSIRDKILETPLHQIEENEEFPKKIEGFYLFLNEMSPDNKKSGKTSEFFRGGYWKKEKFTSIKKSIIIGGCLKKIKNHKKT